MSGNILECQTRPARRFALPLQSIRALDPVSKKVRFWDSMRLWISLRSSGMRLISSITIMSTGSAAIMDANSFGLLDNLRK